MYISYGFMQLIMLLCATLCRIHIHQRSSTVYFSILRSYRNKLAPLYRLPCPLHLVRFRCHLQLLSLSLLLLTTTGIKSFVLVRQR